MSQIYLRTVEQNDFKNVKKWIAKIPNVFILTATPMPNTVEDLWSQIYLIDEEPYRLGKKYYSLS